MTNEEITKMIMAEKDKVTLRYKQKLNNLKQQFGVEFDVDHFGNDRIKSITFVNLKYKNLFINGTVTYDKTNGKFDYIDYDLLETRSFKNLNHKRLISNLDKDYKLKLIVTEVERINNEYLRELNEIDNTLKNAPKNSNNLEISKIYQNEENTE